jgi:hypothetical protein
LSLEIKFIESLYSKCFDGHGGWVAIGERTFLKKAIVISLLYLTAIPAVADDGRIEFASVDRDIYRHQERVVLAPAVCEKNELYEITKYGEKELRDQMARQGIAWSDGKKDDSITSWHVTWDYEHERSFLSCSAEEFQATAEITIRYPKWGQTDAARRSLRTNGMSTWRVSSSMSRGIAI